MAELLHPRMESHACLAGKSDLSCEANHMDERTRKLVTAPVFWLLGALAAPNLLVMITQTAVGLVEVYFLARLGVDVLAGVSSVFPILALITALSQGAMGGGISAAVSRSLGRGQVKEAGDVVWYACGIAIVLGAATSLLLLICGPAIYRSMGADGSSLAAATEYSDFMFSGAILIWLFNALLSIVRGTGNMILPMKIVCGGAVLLVPVSPLLIFGVGPMPGFGIVGGAAAILIYYSIGSVCFALFLRRGNSVLRPTLRPPHVDWKRVWEILNVGGLSALVSISTNVTIAFVTGFVGSHGVGAVAGYGAASRLEFFLVPLSFGIGGPAGVIIGTNIGAGCLDRALRFAWVSALAAGVLAEGIGLLAAGYPEVWLKEFSTNQAALAAGTAYLRSVGPFFGLFGIGFALYCASQGIGKMGWPLAGAFLRSAVAIIGGMAATSMEDVFTAVAVGMAAFGSVCAVGMVCNGYRMRRSMGQGNGRMP